MAHTHSTLQWLNYYYFKSFIFVCANVNLKQTRKISSRSSSFTIFKDMEPTMDTKTNAVKLKEVLSAITREERKLFIKLHEARPKGNTHFVTAIKIAQLVLRHRQNRNQKMRILVFIDSPIEVTDKSDFIKLPRKIKKKKANVDFTCFGETISEENQVLSEFIDTLDGKVKNTSSILVVPDGSKLIEALVSSPICQGKGGGNMAMLMNGGVEFGNADEDPELALALCVSLEESV